MTHLYNSEDRAFLKVLQEHARPEFDAYAAMNKAIFTRTDGVIDLLHREPIAVAVAVSAQCPYCIQSHTKNALNHGASDAEIAEATMIAVAIGADAAATHGAMAMRLFHDAANA